MKVLYTAALTGVAMMAFAANSLLCRMALGQQHIDAASFTLVRMLAGAIMLGILVAPRWRASRPSPDWKAVAALSCYMLCFSFAYLSLTAGTGALLLFGAVQLTMFTSALRDGEKFSLLAWAGLCIAFSGIVYLVAPGVTAPDPLGAALMIVAGVGWGGYTLSGRREGNPLLATASNFAWSLPVVVVIAVGAPFVGDIDLTGMGVLLAVASGALASGVGYAIWYAALKDLRASQAATVQLSVPVIAALGGAVFLMEELTLRMLLASLLALGGIWLMLTQRARGEV